MIFGVVFVSVMLVCLVWTILSYLSGSRSQNNKLENNMKKFDGNTK